MHHIHSKLETRRLPLSAIGILLVLCVQTSGAVDGPFHTPRAGIYEARIGTIIQPAQKKLRLDIGAAIDIIRFQIDTTRSAARNNMHIGVDFMTFTRLRAEHNLKFPVETVDYWFGVRAEYEPWRDLAFRVRAAHISSHLVDGMADTSATFRDQRPFVYSREFIELLASYELHLFAHVYGGLTVITSTQPSSANRLIPQVGIDVDYPLSRLFSLRCGYDWRLIGINGTLVTAQNAQIGLFAETFKGVGRGLMLTLNYYNGRSMHGMFFNQADSYFGVGFQVVW